ncbi:MAG TPA: class I SAM-dependent methyltransferase, partial [Candidatus Avanaerovorax faecigallinarum]|nr:class I SAM-dependent methyltransferase [Candidatus Avanaerovorax faecigallinarum]
LLMSEIMGQDIDKTRTFGKFILQPRNNVGRLRKWLYLSGFLIAEETLVRERNRICEILKVIPAGTAERKNLKAADMEEDVLFEYPDMLVDEPNPLTEEYLRVHLEKERAIKDRILMGSDRSRLCITENRIDRISGLYRRLMK